jgi:hypothetical protein
LSEETMTTATSDGSEEIRPEEVVVPRAAETRPEVEEVYDGDRVLRTMAAQVAEIYKDLPALMRAIQEFSAWKLEFERRMIRAEGILQKAGLDVP